MIDPSYQDHCNANYGPEDIPNESHAKATKGKAGTAGGDEAPVRRSTAGTGLRVGEASADLPATSEIMDVTAGETAPFLVTRPDQARSENKGE